MPTHPPFATALTQHTAMLASAPSVESREQGLHARFYSEHSSLAAEIPHHNPRNGSSMFALNVTCDKCRSPIPLEALHGVINDYAHCTEIRYVGDCPRCQRMAHNVIRVSGDEMRFLQDGKWCVSVKRPWWHCLWPWPIDREWS